MRGGSRVILLGLALAGVYSTPAEMAPAFQLQDQYGESFQLTPPLPRPLVLLLADREASGAVEDWTGPLYARYGSRVDMRGVADLSALPRPLRAMVRRVIRNSVSYPLLLDWSGEVVQAYDMAAGLVHVVVVDTDGRRVHRVSGGPDGNRISGVVRVIDTLLESKDLHPVRTE